MQSKKSAVVGVLITLYLTRGSWCHYIPEKKPKEPSTAKRNESANPEQIQICGNALTTLIIEACDGIVGSLNQGNSTRDSVQTKITEDCCDQECPLDYLQNYCGQTPLFIIKKTLRGKLLSKLTRNRSAGARERGFYKGRKKEASEEQNTINQTWPSIQIGTISPEIDKFGGEPIVVVKKNKSNSI